MSIKCNLYILLLSSVMVFWNSDSVFAQKIFVKLTKTPNITLINIDSPDVIRQIIVEARSNKRVKYRWRLEGPGELDGVLPGDTIFYTVPENIDKKLKQAIITVEVTDEKSITLPYSTIFNLITDSPIVSAGTPQTTPSKSMKIKINKLLRRANIDMRAARYTTPKGNNAFDKYRDVIQMDPDNSVSWKGIRTIIKEYKKLGDVLYKETNPANAKQFYWKYVMVANYYSIQKPEGEPDIKENEFKEIQIRLEKPCVTLVSQISQDIEVHLENKQQMRINPTYELKPGENIVIKAVPPDPDVNLEYKSTFGKVVPHEDGIADYTVPYNPPSSYDTITVTVKDSSLYKQIIKIRVKK